MAITLHTIIRRALRYIAVSKTGYEDLASDEAIDLEDIALNIISRDRLMWPYTARRVINYSALSNIDFTQVDEVSIIEGGDVYIRLERLTTSQWQKERLVTDYDGLSRYFYFQKPNVIHTYPKGTNYTFEIVGKINSLIGISLETDLSDIPPFVRWYFTLSLAKALCPFYEKDWTENRAEELKEAKDSVEKNTQNDTGVQQPRVSNSIKRIRPRYEIRSA